MDEVPCLGCGLFFTPRNRCQNYCSNPVCQKKRKAAWQKEKIKNDPNYKEEQRLSNQKWLNTNPDYWKDYRKRKPEKAKRNRLLQRVRANRSKKKAPLPEINVIAKMDASKAPAIKLNGEFLLIPDVAKMDAAKIIFRMISVS